MASDTVSPQSKMTPMIRVLGQYIKDLSFENPGVTSGAAGRNAPNIDLGIDVSAQPLDENRHFEVALKLAAKASTDDQVTFITELIYAGTFELQEIPDEDLEPILLVECPRLLFPFARRILAEVTREGGFPPLLIDPIDFVGLYRSQKAQQSEQAQQA